jgi:hypothetical protein
LVLSELDLVDEQGGRGLDDRLPGPQKFEPGLSSVGEGAEPLGLLIGEFLDMPLTVRRPTSGQNQNLGLDR